MKYLLDTHTLLWIVNADKKLSNKAKQLYLDIENRILLSIGSIWEIAIKLSRNKLKIHEPLAKFIENQIRGNDIHLLNIHTDHLVQVEKLPFHHINPFDRIVIAQAMIEDIPIISANRHFDHYPIKRIW